MNIDDATLVQNVIDELEADDNLEESTIAVAAKDGVVHLTGTVTTDADRRAAENAAKRANGVTRVVDDLRVETLTR